VLQLLREHPGALDRGTLEAAGPDAAQVDRCLASLVEDGLLEPEGDDHYRLPS
jgi:A/G-specific adenine glycosylase